MPLRATAASFDALSRACKTPFPFHYHSMILFYRSPGVSQNCLRNFLRALRKSFSPPPLEMREAQSTALLRSRATPLTIVF